MFFSLRRPNNTCFLCALVVGLSAVLPALANDGLAGAGKQPGEALLSTGVELEQSRKWLEAVQHYEKASRALPSDVPTDLQSQINLRLKIARVHYDVNRRCQDPSLLDAVREMTLDDSLELYSEILARLEMSFVDFIDMKEVVRGGTAYLEVALTEPRFTRLFLQGQAPQKIEQFRTSVHRAALARPIRSRFEARTIVAGVARLAEQELGLVPSATVLQYICGAVGLLDPYSSFLSEGELSEVESQIEGNFVGLGIALQPHEVPLRILNVISGGPALEAGLRAGDLIKEIGGVKCSDVGAERAADMLRGPANSQVRLVVQRSGIEDFERSIERRRVEVASIDKAYMVDQATGIAYLKISSFQKTTVNELDSALWSLKNQGMQQLIIDLRGNPGGWLDAAVSVADRFVSDGVIVSTRGKNDIENQTYTANRSGTWTLPLKVLIDGDSASASEIFAGAIRDHRRGELIGSTTYGKGSVQGLFHTKSFAGGVRLTVSKFYSPDRIAISEKGVKPHISIDREHFVAKPVIGSDGARLLEDAGTRDVPLETAIQRARMPHLTAQTSRN